jgi:hypothetical protein
MLLGEMNSELFGKLASITARDGAVAALAEGGSEREALLKREVFTGLTLQLLAMNRFLELDPLVFSWKFPNSLFNKAAKHLWSVLKFALGTTLTVADQSVTGGGIGMSIDALEFGERNLRTSAQPPTPWQAVIALGETAFTGAFRDVTLGDVGQAAEGSSNMVIQWLTVLGKGSAAEGFESDDDVDSTDDGGGQGIDSAGDAATAPREQLLRGLSDSRNLDAVGQAAAKTKRHLWESWPAFAARFAFHATSVGLSVASMGLTVPVSVGVALADLSAGMSFEAAGRGGRQNRLESIVSQLALHEMMLLRHGVACDVRLSEPSGANPVCKAAFPGRPSACRQEFAFRPEYRPVREEDVEAGANEGLRASGVLTEVDSPANEVLRGSLSETPEPTPEPRIDGTSEPEPEPVPVDHEQFPSPLEGTLTWMEGEDGSNETLLSLLREVLDWRRRQASARRGAAASDRSGAASREYAAEFEDAVFAHTHLVLQSQSLSDEQKIDFLRATHDLALGKINHSIFQGRCDTLVVPAPPIRKLENGERCDIDSDCVSHRCSVLDIATKKELGSERSAARPTVASDWPVEDWPEHAQPAKGASGGSKIVPAMRWFVLMVQIRAERCGGPAGDDAAEGDAGLPREYELYCARISSVVDDLEEKIAVARENGGKLNDETIFHAWEKFLLVHMQGTCVDFPSQRSRRTDRKLGAQPDALSPDSREDAPGQPGAPAQAPTHEDRAPDNGGEVVHAASPVDAASPAAGEGGEHEAVDDEAVDEAVL